MNTLTSVCMQQVNNLINLIKPSRQVGGATYMPPEYYGNAQSGGATYMPPEYYGTTTTALFSNSPVTFTPPYQMGGCGTMKGGCGCGSPAMPVPESKV